MSLYADQFSAGTDLGRKTAAGVGSAVERGKAIGALCHTRPFLTPKLFKKFSLSRYSQIPHWHRLVVSTYHGKTNEVIQVGEERWLVSTEMKTTQVEDEQNTDR